MKTTSPTSKAPAPPQRRDFAEAMHAKYVAKDGHKAGKRMILIVPALLLAIGIGLGSAARAGLSPAWASAVTWALAALIGCWTVLAFWVTFRVSPLKDVDWATADTYEQELTSDLHPDVRAVLARPQEQVARLLPAADRVHLYSPHRLPDHECTLDTTGCDCARMRLNAAVMPNRRRPVILVGERLLDQPSTLAYVLAHEVNHVRRPWLLVYSALQVVILAGWLGMGLVLPWHTLVVVAHTLFNALAMWGGPPGYAALLVAPAVAAVLLANAPDAAPRWLRRWIRGKPARADRPVKVKGPVL